MIHCNISNTKDREIAGLLDAIKTYDLKTGLILTEFSQDKIQLNESDNQYTINVQPIWRWLLESTKN